jgi:hypothetical protein
MMAVGDKGGGETIISELSPEEIRMPRQVAGHPVAEMRGEDGTRLRRGVDARGISIGMAQSDQDSSAGEVRDVIERAIPLRGQSDQADETAAGGLPALHFVAIRWAHLGAGMSAAGTVGG